MNRNQPEKYKDLILFFKELDEAYRYKAKRFRYMRKRSLMMEIEAIKDGFETLWRKENGSFSYCGPQLPEKGLSVLTGIFGFHAEVQAIFDINRRISGFDREGFLAFLEDCIAKKAARERIYRILFSPEPPSISLLAERENSYIERHLKVFRLIDEMGLQNLAVSADDLHEVRSLIEAYGGIVEDFAEDLRLYRSFLRDARPLCRGRARLSIIGYGEISTVMQISRGVWLAAQAERMDDQRWVWKKMPPFPDSHEVQEYKRVYKEYRTILTERIGLTVPEQSIACFDHGSYHTVYAGQERLDTDAVCHSLIKRSAEEVAISIFKDILEELCKVYRFNEKKGPVLVGIDGQLSNWVIAKDTNGEKRLYYIDTSSPLYRVNGREQLNTEIFIKNSPSFLRAVLKTFFLKEVVDRYYDTRSVIIDAIANLYKEKRPDLIDPFIIKANDIIADLDIPGKMITRKEVDKYYSSDASIWRFYQFSRRIDKFIIEKILRRRYSYRLPQKIER